MPMLTGSAANPNQARPPTDRISAEGVAWDANARTAQQTVAAAPLASHLSCCRRSPEERRQLSTWRAMKASMKARRAR